MAKNHAKKTFGLESLKNWDNIKRKQEARNTCQKWKVFQPEWEGWNLRGYALFFFLGGGGGGGGQGGTRCIMVYVKIMTTKRGPFLWTYFCGPFLIFGHDF